MSKNILELEQRVKDVYADDRTNPELYSAIKDLAEAILVVKRMVSSSEQVSEISHALATDFYIDISSGKLEIHSWTKYIMLRLRTYRGRYYDSNRRVELTTKDCLDADELSNNLYNSSKFSFSSASNLELYDLIEYYPKFILKQFDKCVRYRKGTKEYSVALINIMRMILQDTTDIRMFGDEDPQYIIFLRNVIMKRLENYSNLLCGDKKHDVSSEELIHAYKSFTDE